MGMAPGQRGSEVCACGYYILGFKHALLSAWIMMIYIYILGHLADAFVQSDLQ